MKKTFKRLRGLLQRIPLSIRLTGYFVLFGIIIGYISFIMVTMISSRHFIRMTAELIKQEFNQVVDNEKPDILLSKSFMESNFFRHSLHIMEQDNLHQISNFALYVFQDENDRWRGLKINPESKEASLNSLSREQESILRRYQRHGFRGRPRFFFGRKDTFDLLVNLTRPVDKNLYILHLQINRAGLANFTRENAVPFIIFDLVLFIISFLLGKLFTRKIVKPIRRLSDEAEMIADGDHTHRFTVTTRDEIGRLGLSLNTMAARTEDHIQEIVNRVKTMETMNRIDKEVLSSTSREELLDRVVGFVSTQFEDLVILLVLRNHDKGGFDLLSATNPDLKRFIGGHPFIPDSDVSPSLLDRYSTPFQFTGKENRDLFHNIAGNDLITPGSFLNVPIERGGTYLGSLLVMKQDKTGFDQRTQESLSMLADQVGVAFQSVQHLEEKEALLMGILMALTRSIDAKSRWTAGHSDRVARYAEDIALEMGMERTELRDLGISALLHDIGKIAIPEDILDKPGRLDNKEFNLIKTHPTRGAEIIGEIPSYESIKSGILHHHENWAGQGYPKGLGGKDIPFQARIICVADVYDAITAERPYRKSMTREEAFEFMKEKKGLMFDPEIVDALFAVIATKMEVTG